MNTEPASRSPLRGLRVRVSEGAPSECDDDAAFAGECREEAGTLPHAILLSGGEHECAVRSFAALSPSMLLEAKGRRVRLHTARDTVEWEGDPLAVLEELLAATGGAQDEAGVPVAAGFVAYEAGRLIERLPERTEDLLGLPDLLFVFPTRIRVHDRRTRTRRAFALEWSDDAGPLPALSAHSRQTDAAHGGGRHGAPVHEINASAGFTPEAYMEAVRRVRGHIYEGDVYQVNLSQRFRFPITGDPFILWQRLFAANPAPFYAWIDAGTFQVLSASMERFVLVERDRIETRPIKGTRPRGADDAEDRRLEEELQRSAKDDAELSMIVDLERNDIGRICQPGTVRVAGHKRVERYANVMHLVSVVEGRLRAGTGIAAVFRALFPGGSVTGCPKIRAMEIIDALEPETRHVYTGAIGYATDDGRMDFNIAIRTAVVVGDVCHLSVGGGVVHDSDPREEYQETLHKGRTFFDLAGVRIE